MDYFNYKSSLPNGPRFLARVLSKGTVGNPQILSMMKFRNNSLGDAMTLAATDDYLKVMLHFLMQGYNVNTDYINARPIIKAGYDNPNGEFDRNLHYITAALNPTLRMQREIGQAEVNKVAQVLSLPLLARFIDGVTEQEDSLITPGGLITIEGERLKFDKTDSEQGVYILNGSLTQKPTVFGKISEGLIVCSATDLQGIDNCTIEVRTRSSLTAPMHIGRLSATLSVNRQTP